MKLQSMYVDMRPVLVKWLGLAFLGLFLLWFFYSIQADFYEGLHAIRKEHAQYVATKPDGMNFGYVDWCLRSSDCRKQMVPSWTAATPVKSVILGGAGFSLVCALFGMLWRPEVIAMRDTRINAANIESSRQKSPVAPTRKI